MITALPRDIIEAEALAIAEHEHISSIAAAFGNHLLHPERGRERNRDMLRRDISSGRPIRGGPDGLGSRAALALAEVET